MSAQPETPFVTITLRGVLLHHSMRQLAKARFREAYDQFMTKFNQGENR